MSLVVHFPWDQGLGDLVNSGNKSGAQRLDLFAASPGDILEVLLLNSLALPLIDIITHLLRDLGALLLGLLLHLAGHGGLVCLVGGGMAVTECAHLSLLVAPIEATVCVFQPSEVVELVSLGGANGKLIVWALECASKGEAIKAGPSRYRNEGSNATWMMIRLGLYWDREIT